MEKEPVDHHHVLEHAAQQHCGLLCVGLGEHQDRLISLLGAGDCSRSEAGNRGCWHASLLCRYNRLLDHQTSVTESPSHVEDLDESG